MPNFDHFFVKKLVVFLTTFMFQKVTQKFNNSNFHFRLLLKTFLYVEWHLFGQIQKSKNINFNLLQMRFTAKIHRKNFKNGSKVTLEKGGDFIQKSWPKVDRFSSKIKTQKKKNRLFWQSPWKRE